MNLWHCSECDHEWQGKSNTCSWCGKEGYILVTDVWKGFREKMEKVSWSICDGYAVVENPRTHEPG